MPLYRLPDDCPELVGMERVQFDGARSLAEGIEKFLAAGIRPLCRPGGEVPGVNLFGIHREPFEGNIRAESPELPFKVPRHVPAARVEVAEVVNNGRLSRSFDRLGGRIGEGFGAVPLRRHKHNVITLRYGVQDAGERVLFNPYFDVNGEPLPNGPPVEIRR